MTSHRGARDIAARQNGSAALVVVGVALWFFADVPWSFSVDGAPVAADPAIYGGLVSRTVGALIALAGLRRLLDRAQRRLFRTPGAAIDTQVGHAPVDEPAGRRTGPAPRTLITVGVLLFVGSDVVFTLVPESGRSAFLALVAVGSVASFAGPVLVLVGLYRLLRQVDQHVADPHTTADDEPSGTTRARPAAAGGAGPVDVPPAHDPRRHGCSPRRPRERPPWPCMAARLHVAVRALSRRGVVMSIIGACDRSS